MIYSGGAAWMAIRSLKRADEGMEAGVKNGSISDRVYIAYVATKGCIAVAMLVALIVTLCGC